jgi:hypothetical protein
MVLLVLVHFGPLKATWPKIAAVKTVEVNICCHSNAANLLYD